MKRKNISAREFPVESAFARSRREREREATVAPPALLYYFPSSSVSCNLSHFFSHFYISAVIKKQKKEISESVVEDDDANRERERKIGVTVRTLEVSFAEATVEVKENIFLLL